VHVDDVVERRRASDVPPDGERLDQVVIGASRKTRTPSCLALPPIKIEPSGVTVGYVRHSLEGPSAFDQETFKMLMKKAIRYGVILLLTTAGLDYVCEAQTLRTIFSSSLEETLQRIKVKLPNAHASQNGGLGDGRDVDATVHYGDVVVNGCLLTFTQTKNTRISGRGSLTEENEVNMVTVPLDQLSSANFKSPKEVPPSVRFFYAYAVALSSFNKVMTVKWEKHKSEKTSDGKVQSADTKGSDSGYDLYITDERDGFAVNLAMEFSHAIELCKKKAP
jgi:hypothetical protein